MTTRWLNDTADIVEAFDLEAEVKHYIDLCHKLGRWPMRQTHTDGTVTVHSAGQRPLKFVQRRVVKTRQIGEGRFERHL